MRFVKFRVDTDELVALHADVERALGGKPIGQPVQIPEITTTNASSKLLFGYNVPDEFLANNPKWQGKTEE
ncbi:hypothetical protein P0D88_46550 [Paraburkholderia sp. RL18-103-BIB-C]|uniref:hypothetical protein n=1 Tax=Paraburkholderia sp. RL18-103-BIB-C TaxID=3031637 RepID=UPI0038B6EAF4